MYSIFLLEKLPDIDKILEGMCYKLIESVEK